MEFSAMQHHEEEGREERCSCTIRTRFLLPCSHQIVLGQPIDVTAIHPCWMVQPTLPVIDIPSQDIDSAMLSVLRDPPLAIPRKGRPKESQRLQTSAEKIQNAADRMEKVRGCKSCSKVGHNRRTCSKLKMEANPNPRNSEDNEDFLLGDEDDVAFEEMWADAMSAWSRYGML
ncbi:hypothetical protein V1520DRAFT_393815 [Lipomyces starkeyi]